MNYQIWIEDEAKEELRKLPGNIRQRIRRAIQDLQAQPRPHFSIGLTMENIKLEARRLRIEYWRVIYIVDEEWSEIGILAVRKRPPYNYEDLPDLLKGFMEE